LKLSETSTVPLHVQLRMIIEKEIQKGAFNEKIPSERLLMERFQVSRSTVREAVSLLCQEGVLEKKHGRGTYIKSCTPVEEWISNLNSLSKTIENMGMIPSAKLIQKQIQSNSTIPLNISTEEHYLIERLRFASQLPIAIERHYYPLGIGKLLSTYDLGQIVIYDVLEHELGLTLWETDEMITSRLPTAQEASLLDIPIQTSLLEMKRTLYDQNGREIEYLNSLYRPDLYVFRIKRNRK